MKGIAVYGKRSKSDGDSFRRCSVVLYPSLNLQNGLRGLLLILPLRSPRAAMWSSKWRRCPAWCAWASALASWPSSTVRACGWPSRGPPAPPTAAPSPAPSSPTASPSSPTARRRSPTCPPSRRFSPPTSLSPLASSFPPPPPLLQLPRFHRRRRRIRRRRQVVVGGILHRRRFRWSAWRRRGSRTIRSCAAARVAPHTRPPFPLQVPAEFLPQDCRKS